MNIESKIRNAAGIGLIAVASLAGCDRVKFVDPAQATPTVAGTPTPKGEDRIRVVTATPNATEVAKGPKITGELFSIQGVPSRVDAKNVDTAKGGFKNTIGLGSEMIIAEPGVLKVGWDFPQDQFKQAGKSIYHYDSGNQAVLQTPEGFVNVPEEAFGMLNGNAMTIDISGNSSARFHLEIGGPVANHNIVIVRGLYPDGSTPTDRNRIARITNYTPGAVLYDMYPRGGFVSQGQFEQIAQNALTNNPNCGAEACRTVNAYFLDLNTGAFSVIARSGETWNAVSNNWK